MGRLRLAFGLAAIGLLTLTVATPAHAITRRQANAIALAALKPHAERSHVVLFGLPKPVRAGQVVTELARPGLLKRPGKPAWLFWEDREPGAMFQHDSVVLIVDDATGAVVRRKRLAYYPLVDGRPPPYLASPAAYNGPRYRVYASPPPARQATPATRSHHRRPVGVAPGTFAEDCILLVPLTPGNGIERSNELAALAGWSALAVSLRVPAYVATAAGPLEAAGPLVPPPFEGQIDDAGLLANVRTLVERDGCKDVVVYVAGHGAEAPEPASIQLAVQTLSSAALVADQVSESKEVTPDGFAAVASAVEGKATLKWILDTCFAERMLAGLTGANNRIALASSRADETSKFNLNGLEAWTGVAPAVPNPGMAEFTHGVIAGIGEVVAGDAQVGDFADLLDQAFAREQRSDRAAASGQTHPVKLSRVDTEPAIRCSGTIGPYGTGGVEIVVAFSCADSAAPGRRARTASITRFDVQLPGNRRVTNWLAPAGFTCGPAARATTDDTLRCTGALALSTTVSANIRMSPGPSSGMGASLYAIADGVEVGPFAMPGP